MAVSLKYLTYLSSIYNIVRYPIVYTGMVNIAKIGARRFGGPYRAAVFISSPY